MSDDFAQFNSAFFEEAAEHMAVIETGLLDLEQRPEDLDLLNKIFRSAHSIKGVAGMLGFTSVAQFTHKMETLLDQLRNGRIAVTQPITDLLLKSTDCLKALIEAAQNETTVDEAMVHPLEIKLEAASTVGAPSAGEPARGEGQAGSGTDQISSPAASTSPAASAPSPIASSPVSEMHRFVIHWTPPVFLFQRGLDPQQVFKELGDLGKISEMQLDSSRLPDLVGMEPEQCYLAWTLTVETAKSKEIVEGVFEFVREDSALTIEEQTKSEGQGATSDAKDPGASPLVSGLSPLAVSESDPKPLGEILIETGVVSRETLDHALAQQKRVGEILIEQHAATPQQITQALQKQQEGAAVHAKKGTDTASIRVDTAKIDKLINLVGELVITQSMLSDLSARFEMSQLPVLLERVAQLERNTREIQERVMGIRMLPIGSAFSRRPRWLHPDPAIPR
ncbi:MAG: Hpt domain-containing protein, partial [Nitrospiraceae bacterium]